MSQQNEIKEKVKGYILNNFLFGDESIVIDNGDSFMEKGIIDSTGMLELITFVEEQYSMDIEDHEMIPKNLDSLENISSFIIKKIS